MTDKLYQDSITSYFYLNERIKLAYEAIEDMRYRHKHRNYCTSVVFHEQGISVQGFNLEREVIDYADAERLAFKRIERLKQRQARFKQALDRLEPYEVDYLKRKYEQGADVKTQVDIEEKALTIFQDMEDYKHELSRYRQSSYERAEIFNQQKEAMNALKKEERDTEYNEWLADIEQVIENKDIIARLHRLSASKGDLQATSSH